MRVLVIGSGAREHALAARLASELEPGDLVAAPGNPGISSLARTVSVDTHDVNGLAERAVRARIGLTVVGPELPLSLGIADRFAADGQLLLGRTAAGARLESSKAFAKAFMARHQVPTARFRTCQTADEALASVRSGEFGWPVVLKADGLAAGKGVVIADDCPAAESAVRHYGADPDKIAVIPWGANLPQQPNEAEVLAAIQSRTFDTCELVFIGRDWQRKGGDLLVANVKELNRRGLPTHATIIGCTPPNLPADRFDSIEYLNKADTVGFARFTEIMRAAHFLFLPSHAEAYGQAFCEAMSFGVPVIASTVGGIPTIVRNGETGFLKPPGTRAAQFADIICESFSSPDRYRAMAIAARDDYRDRLNWNQFGRSLGDTIAALV